MCVCAQYWCVYLIKVLCVCVYLCYASVKHACGWPQMHRMNEEPSPYLSVYACCGVPYMYNIVMDTTHVPADFVCVYIFNGIITIYHCLLGSRILVPMKVCTRSHLLTDAGFDAIRH